MSSFVLPLNSSEATLPVAGGKGANLAEMIRAGFPVPPGFVITTAAYRAFVVANGLQGRIVALSHSAHADDPADLEAASQAIQDLFDQGLIPNDVGRDITAGYRRLTDALRIPTSEDQGHNTTASSASDSVCWAGGLLPIAIRSSATTEDLPDASFAGQHDTYLNVKGEMALLEAVKCCWSSLWTARAMAYRARRDVNPAAISLAVVVQQMVPADTAGILYTVDPLTDNHDEAVINATWGLGKAIVDGRVTPDTVVVDKSTNRVKHRQVGDKAVMTVLTAGGTTEVPVEPQLCLQPALSSEQAAELVRLGCAIESHFGAPQDVEWAITGDRVYILQSRPVTNLPGAQPGRFAQKLAIPGDDDWPAVGEQPAQDFDLWTQANLGEVWPHPVSPLMWSGVPLIVSGGMRYTLRGLNSPYLDATQWAKRFYGRVYYNEGALAHLLSQELGLPGSLVDAALGSRRNADHKRDGRFRPSRFLRRLPFLLRITMRQLRTGMELENLFPEVDHWAASFMEQSLDQLSDRELWTQLMVWADRFMRVVNATMELSSSSVTAFALLEWLTMCWFGRKGLAQDLVTGLSGVHGTEMGTALWQMAQTLSNAGLADIVLDNDPRTALIQLRRAPGAQRLIQTLESFLQCYGHHCPNEGEWLYPRWADAPEQVVEVIAGYLRAGDRVNPNETEAHQRWRREEATTWVRTHLGPVRWSLFRFLLARTQRLVCLRNNGKNCYMKASFPIRRIHAQFGHRWATRGWLGQPDDIFFLSILEVEQVIETGDPATAGLDLSALVIERLKAFECWFTVEAPEVIGSDGHPIVVQAAVERSGSVLRGTPASGGLVQGRVRIIHDPRQATWVQPDDILVTRATDPGWTPVFPLVAGLVIEIGGQLSHAAITAREYGVPAVVNVRNATQRLRDGQTIIVDGSTGRVYLDSS